MGCPFTIRLTPREGGEDYPALIEVLEKIGGAYLVVREHATNMHYHAIVYSDKTDAATRSTLTNHKVFKGAGNPVFSVKNATKGGSTELKALLYICKGDSEHPHPKGGPPEVVARKGLQFTDEAIKKYHDQYWAVSEKTRTSKDLSFPQQIENYMKINNMEFTEENCVDAALTLTLESKTTLNEFFITGAVKFVMAKSKRAYRQAIKESILMKVKMT